jgi:predicted nucleic acid-binding Zn ribbon protein
VKRRRPTSTGECSRKWLARMKRVHGGIVLNKGKYDPRVDYRMMMHFAVDACRHCGKPFCIYHPKQMYCSDKCNKNAWYARHPKHKCAICGEVFRGTQKTCSHRCRLKYDSHYKAHCARCHHIVKPGCEILPDADTRLPKHRRKSRWDTMPVVFCSGRCRDALGWSPSYKICAECGEMYWPKTRTTQRTQKYCSTACRNDACRRRKREARPLPVCRRCGEAFQRSPASRREYCSDECRREATLAAKQAWYHARRSAGILVRMPERVVERVVVAGD